ncbi:conserved Plasmodium membrane protein, unknown function [Plasmodium gaboni]|uniref:Tyrosine-protein kinase ephrin type A/B receptor-like domain-containing protein n=1 Tax=Plasmodium gaboni TaxID=647221 RepID=A0ABY1UJ25_9APIC|nr:conserved Plasmodium membrane protein, unknown function [Plasmodium gaboni]
MTFLLIYNNFHVYLYIIFFVYILLFPCCRATSFSCSYGEYLKNNKCYPCEENKYSSYKNAEGCFKCPPSSFHKKLGVKSIHECICEKNYYLNYLRNSCDRCVDLNNNISSSFYCKEGLNILEIDYMKLFSVNNKENITFYDMVDTCYATKDIKNIYPYINNNIYIYCKRPNICLNTCGMCATKYEGYLCDNCIDDYYKNNIYIKYSNCKKCYSSIIFILFIFIIYSIVIFYFFICIIHKCINISLYFYHYNIYKKDTIYFLHYFRQFVFYLSLMLILALSNDLTESERENYNILSIKNNEAIPYNLHSGDITKNYYMNIYVHNLFYDFIKLLFLHFINLLPIKCFLKNIKNDKKVYVISQIDWIQLVVSIYFFFLFCIFTIICNVIYLCVMRRMKYNNLLVEGEQKEEVYINVKVNINEETLQKGYNPNCVHEQKKIRNPCYFFEYIKFFLRKTKIKYFFGYYIYPMFISNYCYFDYIEKNEDSIKKSFLEHYNRVTFLKSSIQIYYYQYIFITLYIFNSLIMFIYLSPYICISMFKNNKSYYDPPTFCYDKREENFYKYLGIFIIFSFCFLFYMMVFVCLYRMNYNNNNKNNSFRYVYIFGFYTYLYKNNKYYYYILKIFFLNSLFIFVIQMKDHLSSLIIISFLFLVFICVSLFIDPFIKLYNYNIKFESMLFMFLFFLSIQLEIIRLITYHILLRIYLSFISLFIYSFILFYYMFFMIKDVYVYFSLYIKYMNEKNNEKEGNDKIIDIYFFYYYVKKKMNIDISFYDVRKNISTEICLKKCYNNMESFEDVEKDQIVGYIGKDHIEFIYDHCIFISPFIEEAIIQCLFLTKNIRHVISLCYDGDYNRIYNFLFENGYVEIQKTSVQRFLCRSIYIYQNMFKYNTPLFIKEIVNIFTTLVKKLQCFKDVYIREAVAKRIREKYKMNEIYVGKKKKFDENYEEKHINTFLCNLRCLNKNADEKNEKFIKLFPNIGKVVPQILPTKKK